MAQRHAQLRSRAASDVDDAIAYLRGAADDTAALQFIDDLELGINQITRSPNAGSLRFAYELGIPELRAWGLRRFPYVIFHVPLSDGIDIWRVLHTRRDIPGAFERALILLACSSSLIACGARRDAGDETSLATPTQPSAAESTVSAPTSSTPPTAERVPSTDQNGTVEYWAEGFVVETPSHGPMITHVLEGPLPAGGEVALDNWSWDAVSDEQHADGHIWCGPWHIVGTLGRVTTDDHPTPTCGARSRARPAIGTDPRVQRLRLRRDSRPDLRSGRPFHRTHHRQRADH